MSCEGRDNPKAARKTGVGDEPARDTGTRKGNYRTITTAYAAIWEGDRLGDSRRAEKISAIAACGDRATRSAGISAIKKQEADRAPWKEKRSAQPQNEVLHQC
ncbi:hypothetical protein H6F89_25120 [Cyanobacteria bacterium FACHB-63]|nr:hypothetical protein [Cyanobacteria bacterium FACHB-63]